jgi:RNA polymerase sigma-70 factor, ECF subfamily
MSSKPGTTTGLEGYRSYLLLLARFYLANDPQNKIEPSDVVQQTLLEAHKQWEAIPQNPEELCAWLRTVLDNNIHDQRRHWRRQKRDVRRERPIEPAFTASSQLLLQRACAIHASPSQHAIRDETLLELSNALWQLPERQREAIVLHYLQGWHISRVAKELVSSEAAVAGLLHRGLQKLQRLIAAPD